MKKRQLLFALLGLLAGWGTAGMAQAAEPTVSFLAGDQPGSWWECANTGSSASGLGCVPESPDLGTIGLKSLAIIQQNETVGFPSRGGRTMTVHTAVPLIYPSGSQVATFKADVNLHLPPGVETVTLDKPGLYVFICDIHVYMFAGVIVVPTGHSMAGGNLFPLDLGKTLDLPLARYGGWPITGMPTASDLALRLARTFFIITNPNNWQSYPASGTATWNPIYPKVPVRAYPLGSDTGVEINLDTLMDLYFGEPVTLSAPVPPTTPGVGQVWVNTQFEQMYEKNKPGTATAVNADSWKVERKVGLPQINMNNPHNMWTDKDQKVIYQTQWFDERLTVFDRKTGAFMWDRDTGPAPSHVMTRANNDEVHVAQNGGNNVMEYKSLANGNGFLREIPMGTGPVNTNPHGHWMSADGMTMVTPNEKVATSTVYDFAGNAIKDTIDVGHAPLATGMMPNGSKYYVANFLDSTLSVIDISSGTPPYSSTPINLLANYDKPFNLRCGFVLADPSNCADVLGPVGGLPIQTPVSPDGRFMVTANTLTATITVVDTTTNTVVAMLPCDPGCHGVQFGAKKGGGYYAYVANKFSNRMLVVDPDPNGAALPNNGSNAVIAGTVLLTEANKISGGYHSDGTVSGLAGMGGQGVLAVPNVYNGWVQQWVENCKTKDCNTWKKQLTSTQKNP